MIYSQASYTKDKCTSQILSTISLID